MGWKTLLRTLAFITSLCSLFTIKCNNPQQTQCKFLNRYLLYKTSSSYPRITSISTILKDNLLYTAWCNNDGTWLNIFSITKEAPLFNKKITGGCLKVKLTKFGKKLLICGLYPGKEITSTGSIQCFEINKTNRLVLRGSFKPVGYYSNNFDLVNYYERDITIVWHDGTPQFYNIRLSFLNKNKTTLLLSNTKIPSRSPSITLFKRYLYVSWVEYKPTLGLDTMKPKVVVAKLSYEPTEIIKSSYILKPLYFDPAPALSSNTHNLILLWRDIREGGIKPKLKLALLNEELKIEKESPFLFPSDGITYPQIRTYLNKIIAITTYRIQGGDWVLGFIRLDKKLTQLGSRTTFYGVNIYTTSFDLFYDPLSKYYYVTMAQERPHPRVFTQKLFCYDEK